MALKAGRVGVNPDFVDNSGRPIIDTSSYYNKTEADAKFATNTALAAKADQSNLTANSKDFVFAYSGGQYGYKAGSTGDFHPFEEAGVTIMGWVKPADLITTGLTYHENVTYVEGGYCIKDDYCYVDITVKNVSGVDISAGNVTIIDNLPEEDGYVIGLPNCFGNIIDIDTIKESHEITSYNINVLSHGSLIMQYGNFNNDRVKHIFGQYKILQED